MVKDTTLSPAPLASFVVKRRRFWWPPLGEGMSNPRSPSAPVNTRVSYMYSMMNTTYFNLHPKCKKNMRFICYCKTDCNELHFSVQVSGFSKLFRKKCEGSWLAKTLNPVSTWIRINFGRLDPSPHWECGSGSRSRRANMTQKKGRAGFFFAG
jgi:hypothetical protein